MAYAHRDVSTMRANYDQENDILYIVVKDGAAFDSKELEDDLRVEYDQKGDIVGLEVFGARRNIGRAMAEEIAQHASRKMK
jgi:uncharacterized protein YuzE